VVLVIVLNKIEFESFSKSFILFFISLNILFGFLFFTQYKESIKLEDENIFNKMKICSFDLKCKNFTIDFVDKSDEDLFTL